MARKFYRTFSLAANTCISAIAFALALGTVMAAACHSTDATGVPHNCNMRVNSITQPRAGVMTLVGKCYANEYFVVYSGSLYVGNGPPSVDQTEYSIGFVPYGAQNIAIDVTCEGGKDHIGPISVELN